ncbi:Pentatricopeptide repeat-containing protein [Durusdinium trenchii]|uniref:Chloroplastic n=1 Tax=Durusdinium trenchii TaxID=1381693 RepID=A0ABP0JT70_9DINO
MEKVPPDTCLKFDQRLEFNEGDIGVAGGIQVYEPSNLNPTTVDSVRRFGGSTAPGMPWPQDPLADDQSDDRLEKLEKLVVKAMKTITDKKGGSMPTGYSGASGMPQSSQSGASSGGSGDGSK